MAKEYQDPLEAFDEAYLKCICKEITLPLINHEQVMAELNKFTVMKDASVKLVGHSYKGLPIRLLSIGSGSASVFAWSQMHGDEPTATAALCDFLNLLTLPEYQKWRKSWQDKITLHLLPMLNPDGAHRVTRQNAQGIDINRDASALQSPEGVILKTLLDQLKPDVALNLHDQNRYYAAGDSKQPATLSFLAPPGDPQNSLTNQRRKAMTLISGLVEQLQTKLGKRIAKYEDEYSVRAFGDYASSIGASCILIESGETDGLMPRDEARKYNVFAYLHILNALCSDIEDEFDLYDQLPLNKENGMVDLMLREVTLFSSNGKGYCVDIAIDKPNPESPSQVREVGDLFLSAGFKEVPAQGLKVLTGRLLELTEPLRLTSKEYLSLLGDGVCGFYGKTDLLKNDCELPIYIGNKDSYNKNEIIPGVNGTLLLGNSTWVEVAIIDGNVIDLRNLTL